MPPSEQSFEPAASLQSLHRRANLLRRLRAYFGERGFMEVETPLLASEIIPELHIEPIRTAAGQFLQASPELHMKRLLAAGATAIYQVTRSFRGNEHGQLHNPEFTIVEWYRLGDDMFAGMKLLDELVHALLDTPPALRTPYSQAFLRTLLIDPHCATTKDLAATARNAKVAIPGDLNLDERDEWLNLLLSARIEPRLGRDRPEIIYHYPASQASLAKVVQSESGHEVAERFELYYRGIELANGFHELGDVAELRGRFEAVNAARVANGRETLPLPETLLTALKHGLPPCTGCALGFDRLAMLALKCETIEEVIAFPQQQ